jgi:hypothetical protein
MSERLLSARVRALLLAAIVIAAVIAVGSVIAGDGRFWPAYLSAAVYAVTLALGGAVFIAIHHVTNAAWTVPIRRVPEALAGFMPLGALAMLATIGGAGVLYAWTHPGAIEATPETAFKIAWLHLPFFAVRMVLVLGLWTMFVVLLRRESLRQDREPGVGATMRSRVLSGAFLVVLAITITTASVDWLMSVQPGFASTLYGWYVFSGVFVSGLAATAVLVTWLRSRGALAHGTDEHLHSLGKRVFGFATFWAYLWFCQYMLIYYTNMPEEGSYYASRAAVPGGVTLFYVNLALGWIVPFVVLIGRGAKRNPFWLVLGSLSVLVAHYVDIATIVLPPTAHTAIPGLVDVALLAGFVALVLLVVDRALGQAKAMPLYDPYLEEGIGARLPELERT